MAADQTYLRRMGAARRIGRGVLALFFMLTGITLALTVLIVGALNIAPVRQALLQLALESIESEELRVDIADIGGSWPRQLVIEELRLGDGNGEWLTLARLELDWHPLALWRGTVHVERLVANGLTVLRSPAGGETEAETDTRFEIPMLPIAIDIRHLELGDMRIGESVAGQDVTLDAKGALTFAHGGGTIMLEATRVDGIMGGIGLVLAYSPARGEGDLSLTLEDGAAGRPGLARSLLGIDGLDHFTMRANGLMREGLITGNASINGGTAIDAELDVHGALTQGTSLNLQLAASGNLIARELAFAGRNAALQLDTKITPQRRGVYDIDVRTLAAGALSLMGELQATPNIAGGWRLTGEGQLAGLDSLLDSKNPLLSDFGWKLAADVTETFEAIHITEVSATTGAGILRASGNAVIDNGFSFTGEGIAEISDLGPLGEMLGQAMQGEANLSFSSIVLTDAEGSANVSFETGAITTGNASLDALFTEGVTGQMSIGFGNETAFSVEDASLMAGRVLAASGRFALGVSGAMDGAVNIGMADLGVTAGEMAQGRFSASARFSGPIENPDVSLNAQLAQGTLAGFNTREATLRADLAAGKGPLAFRLDGADGTATLSASIDMPGDGGARLDAINANFFGAAIKGALAISPEGLARGELSGERMMLAPFGRLAGFSMDGRGNLTLALAADDGKQNANLTFDARRIDVDIIEPIALDQVTLRAALMDLTGSGAMDAKFEAESGAAGNTRFSRIEASGKGHFDRLAVAVRLEGERLSLKAEPVSLDIAAEATPNIITLETFDASMGTASARLANPMTLELGDGLTRLRAMNMHFDGPQGAGLLTGDVTLQTRRARLDLTLEQLPLELVSPFMPFEVLAGTASGRAELDTGAESGKATLRFDGATLAEGGLDIRPAFDASLDAIWASRRLALTAEAKGISEVPFRLEASLPLIRDPQGALPVLPKRGPVDARLTWNGPIATLMALTDRPGQRLTGDAEIALSADGDISAPQLSGHARIANGTFENFETGTAMRDLSLNIEGRRSEVLSFTMSARDSANGRLSAEGTISLAADAVTPANIRARFDNMRMVSRRDLVLAVDGELSLKGSALPPNLDEPLKLEGSLTTTEARYLIPQQLPGGISKIDVIIVHGPEESDTVQEPEEARPLPLELDITLAIGNPPARVTGRGVDSLWRGSVRVTGLVEDPVIEGVLTSERGTLDFAGKTFTLSRGRVIFAGERPIDPLLDLALDYARSDFSATVSLSGRGSSPSIDLSSSPALPRDEIISRILFGKGVGELTAFEAAQLANTVAELSGGGIGGFGVLSEIQDMLGLDVLRVDQGTSGATTVSAGKYLREGFYVGVEQGALASDSNIKVEIDVTRNISVETKIGNDTSSDIGVNWKWDY
ncbi:MAG: translocation/assembly module TamB domain-containing protein [Pseudomonadota bacterium]